MIQALLALKDHYEPKGSFRLLDILGLDSWVRTLWIWMIVIREIRDP